MKKVILFILIILAMLMFTASCKHIKMEFDWELVEGSGSYSSASNTSTLRMQGWLKIRQSEISRDALFAHLADWQFTVKTGNTPVITFLKGRANGEVGDVYINTSESQYLWLWVYIETTVPKSGDIFRGLNPDTVTLSVLVEDDSMNQYGYEASATFQFTRN